MKNKKTLLVIILVFVVLIGGANVLYNRLGQEVTAQQMVIHADPQPTDAPSSQEEAPEPQSTDAPSSQQEASEPQEVAAPPEAPKTIMAPDFTVYDKDGGEVRLSQYFGKPIVLNFWASWCGPCQAEMPDFNEKYGQIGDEVNFIMINMTDGNRETVESASSFIERNGYDFPVFYDTTTQAAMTYGAFSLPTSYFINAQGHVIAQAVGAIDGATLQKGIDMITSPAP